MPPAPKRRWFRFSLRTLFVVVTVGCIWLAWNVNIVQQRKAVRERARVEKASKRLWGIRFIVEPQGNDPQTAAAREFLARVREASTHPSASQDLSTVRRWMGDKPADQIVLRDQAEVDSVSRVFPEAAIWVLSDSDPMLP
jgi:hypothetical protein